MLKLFPKILFIVLSFFLLFSIPLTKSRADTVLTVCGENPSKDKQDQSHCTFFDIFRLIAKITNVLIGFAAVYAVFRIVVSGTQMIFSGGNPGVIKEGKAGLSGAIKGFILVFAAFLIVNTIFSLFAVSIGDQTDFTLIPEALYR